MPHVFVETRMACPRLPSYVVDAYRLPPVYGGPRLRDLRAAAACGWPNRRSIVGQ
jgi:hypothetical protein